jgi:aryl-alcohol dehydrogenase-like predicted oxidoreductase
MIYRSLGNTEVRVSEVGMGCNRLGEAGPLDEHWVNLVGRAADLGVTVYDSSESYNWGRSEEMLGRALRDRDDVVIATKISRLRDGGGKDFSAARVLERAEASLRRLRRSRIDIYQLHSPSRTDLERFDWAEGMERLKRQGKVRLGGVALSTPDDGCWLIGQGLAGADKLVEVFQCTYNLFQTGPQERLFALALEHGVGLLCRMPLARGILTGKFHAGEELAEGHRALLDGERIKRIHQAEALRPLGDAYEGGMTRLAMHYSLAPEAISAIIPGARTVKQLEENVRASGGPGLSAEVRAEIARIQREWHA